MERNSKGDTKVNTKFSDFLVSKERYAKKLIDIMSKNFDYVSVLGTDVFGKVFSVSKEETIIKDSNWSEQGFVIRVYKNKRFFEYSTNEMTDAEETAEKILSLFDETESLNMNFIEYPQFREDSMTETFSKGYEKEPQNNEHIIIEKLTEIKDKAFSLSDNLISFDAIFEWVKVSKFFISRNKNLKQSYLWSQGYCIPTVSDGSKIKYSYKTYSGLKGLELIDEMIKGTEENISHTNSLLKAKRITPGEYEIICSPEISGLIAHEAFGHGVEMDMFVKNRAKAAEYIGKRVGSDLVNMRDGAKSAEHVSSYFFDDEGVPAQDIKIIEKGILLDGICDTLSALYLKKKPTGNGKRQSFERKAYTRMTNTFFEPGNDKLEDMIKSVKNGFLLIDEMSGMEDPKEWGIQCMILSALKIENGVLTDEVYSPVILTGYVPDVLSDISMVSGDFSLSGSGACGKGYKEFVKVSAGGPYIKTKARLG